MSILHMNLIKLLRIMNTPIKLTRPTTTETPAYRNENFWDEFDTESRIIERLFEEAERINTPRTTTSSIGSQTCVRSIAPYRLHGQWVFDDPSLGLRAEAFVCGMSEILDQLLRDSGIDPKQVRKGFRLTYSPVAFPHHVYAIRWLRAESGGNIYTCEQNGMSGWLCPALYKYFDKAPERIYFSADLLDE